MKVGDIVRWRERGSYHRIKQLGDRTSDGQIIYVGKDYLRNDGWFDHRFNLITDPAEIMALILLGKIK